eukprot:COSAG04_NODE_8565_length_957_cov_1.593240_1_plen_56_part_10
MINGAKKFPAPGRESRSEATLKSSTSKCRSMGGRLLLLQLLLPGVSLRSVGTTTEA